MPWPKLSRTTSSPAAGLPVQLRQVVLYHEGVLLQRSGRFEGAQKALSSLCLSGVNSEELTETYGLTVLHLRDAKPPAPGTQESDIVEHLGRGACLGGQKNYDAARLEYELVIRQYPHFPLVYYAYGELLLAARDRAAVAALARETASTLREMAASIEATAEIPRLEDLERRLTVLEEKLFAVLMAATPDDDLVEVRAQADRDLIPYRKNMPAAQIEQLQKQYIRKLILERSAIPRLSLFYMH